MMNCQTLSVWWRCQLCGVDLTQEEVFNSGGHSCCDETQNEREENEKMKALTQWQPIETAPKGDPENVFDKPEVDLFIGSNRYPNCFYDHETGYWTMRVRYLTKAGVRKTVYMKLKNPTHWMPIPQPPEVTT